MQSNENFVSNIYPNPTANIFTIKANEQLNNAIIKLTNITGQVIFEKQNQTGNQFSFDISNQPQGIYFIQIQQQNRTWHNKIIKQ